MTNVATDLGPIEDPLTGVFPREPGRAYSCGNAFYKIPLSDRQGDILTDHSVGELFRWGDSNLTDFSKWITFVASYGLSFLLSKPPARKHFSTGLLILNNPDPLTENHPFFSRFYSLENDVYNKSTDTVKDIARGSIPLNSLKQVPRPKQFDKLDVLNGIGLPAPYNITYESSTGFGDYLEAITWRFECNVPENLAGINQFGFQPRSIPLRGWICDASDGGVWDPQSGKHKRSIVFIKGGFPTTLFSATNMGETMKSISSLTLAGFTVVLVDRQGQGVSGGAHSGPTAHNSGVVFDILDQLESGVKVIAPYEKEIRSGFHKFLLPGGAKTVPVSLVGISYGAGEAALDVSRNFNNTALIDHQRNSGVLDLATTKSSGSTGETGDLVDLGQPTLTLQDVAAKTFTDASGSFLTDSVAEGDYLVLDGGSDDDAGYRIDSVISETQLKVSNKWKVGSLSSLSYKIGDPIPITVEVIRRPGGVPGVPGNTGVHYGDGTVRAGWYSNGKVSVPGLWTWTQVTSGEATVSASTSDINASNLAIGDFVSNVPDSGNISNTAIFERFFRITEINANDEFIKVAIDLPQTLVFGHFFLPPGRAGWITFAGEETAMNKLVLTTSNGHIGDSWNKTNANGGFGYNIIGLHLRSGIYAGSKNDDTLIRNSIVLHPAFPPLTEAHPQTRPGGWLRGIADGNYATSDALYPADTGWSHAGATYHACAKWCSVIFEEATRDDYTFDVDMEIYNRCGSNYSGPQDNYYKGFYLFDAQHGASGPHQVSQRIDVLGQHILRDKKPGNPTDKIILNEVMCDVFKQDKKEKKSKEKSMEHHMAHKNMTAEELEDFLVKLAENRSK